MVVSDRLRASDVSTELIDSLRSGIKYSSYSRPNLIESKWILKEVTRLYVSYMSISSWGGGC